MRWFDGHCDVLYRMWKEPNKHQFYHEECELDVSYHKLMAGKVDIQVFAVFIPPKVAVRNRREVALKQIDLFYQNILAKSNKMKLIKGSFITDRDDKRIGAMLALEGADALEGDLLNLRIFYYLGVRQIGLTWNYANEVADGIEEMRGAGLTEFGKRLLREMNKLGMVADISHLSVQSFWDVLAMPQVEIVASHSNSFTVCPHKRNLTDEQIKAIISRKGLIGLTFYPPFVAMKKQHVTISDLLRHIDHVCALGGGDHLVFGSDFDGIDQKINLLENASQLLHLKEVLCKYYEKSLVEKWAYTNANQFYSRVLAKL
ncbi:dipeptidase [Hazenella sp. IB182353]|uniref:dipeptidase n=1 Tax=Polycladospora coralii TaxID=2771432 RepID=UPI0017471B28|nr:dipeptidase [Polycladospora coralii]MBS7530852.1 dipeptidase [Polycladospora coralii]